MYPEDLNTFRLRMKANRGHVRPVAESVRMSNLQVKPSPSRDWVGIGYLLAH
jgi:hypothetical protein